ncbi:MAG: hypothetical protein Q8Q50_04855 [Methylobacter sp.]|jgi:hypothetical protein|nr:hypothetical protein [Methylobacter sp.]
MFEALFILTTIFVAYVVYAIVDEQKEPAKPRAPAIKPEAPQVAAVAEKVAEEKPAVTRLSKAAPKPPATKAAVTKAKAVKKAPVTAVKNSGLKDPKTGEVATTYSNYRFTKRWIKDALVTEGLLDKVYKNNELNADTETAIKQAIAKLEAMDKYRA